jgi:hypothetical protein
MANSLFRFRQSLGLTQYAAARFLNMSPSLVAKTEAQNLDLYVLSDASSNLLHANVLLNKLPPIMEESDPGPDTEFVNRQIQELKRDLQLRLKEHEKSTRAYQTARKKMAFVAAMRADPEFERRNLENILNLMEADAKLDLEKYSLAVQKKQSLLIRCLEQQIEFWENVSSSQ